MIQLGVYNTLEVIADTKFGLFLGHEEDEVLLPKKYVPQGAKIGDTLTVFVYRDNEERPVATTLNPKIQLHQFAYLEVRMIGKNGAWLDWGLEKDLFVPFREQGQPMEAGKSYLVYLYIDEKTDRLTASSRVGRYLDNTNLSVEEGDEVDVIIWKFTPLGVKVIIDHLHEGLIYQNELFANIRIGDHRKAYIKKIREGNKVDVDFHQQGYVKVEPNAQRILDTLKKADGFVPLNDKSDPESIKKKFEISKKTFKKAIGMLYKQRLIRIEKDGIYLK